jgi:hypothetical protein
LLLFFAAGALLYGLTLGRDRIVIIMVSIYMGLAMVTNAPYLRDISGTFNQVALRAGIFVGIFILLFLFLSRNATLRAIDSGRGGGIFQTALFSVLHVGLLVSVGLSLMPNSALGEFSAQTRGLFVSDPARFAWLIAPIGAMMIFSGRSESPRPHRRKDRS